MKDASRMYYIANARIPTEKAHGIQIAKTCEAFLKKGIDLRLIVPRRTTIHRTLQEYYALSVPIPIVKLPVIDIYHWGPLGFYIGSLSYMASYLLYLGYRRLRGENFIVYTVDMDTFSFSMLYILGRPYVSEIHTQIRSNILTRLFFAKSKRIIAINEEVKRYLCSTFGLPAEHILIEPNGVEISTFDTGFSAAEARSLLGLSSKGPICMYVGRFYSWKGLGILVDVAKQTPEISYLIVGGTKETFSSVTDTQDLPPNIEIMGSEDVAKIPLWLSAADVLLVVGTAQNEDSYRYTAPMKVFEYMAARRPVVASATPALRSMLQDEVIWYQPDNTDDLAVKIREAIKSDFSLRVTRAYERASIQDWQARAERILDFIYK